MGQADDAGALFVKFGAIFLIIAVDAGHIDQDIYELRAYLIVLHIDGGGVRGDVDF